MSDSSLIVCKYLPDSNAEIERQIQLTYNDAFPLVERRDFVDVVYLLRTEKRFNLELIMHSDNYVGFITWWDFYSFVYIEHFAIDEKHRNEGYGGKALSLFLQNLKKWFLKKLQEPGVNGVQEEQFTWIPWPELILNILLALQSTIRIP